MTGFACSYSPKEATWNQVKGPGCAARKSVSAENRFSLCAKKCLIFGTKTPRIGKILVLNSINKVYTAFIPQK
jgi:hypothetical protein